MAYRSLILGMIFSIGIFAAKSGLGMAFGTQGDTFRIKALCLSVFSLTYGLVFLGAGLFLAFFDILSHVNDFQVLIQSGMLIHVIMAVLMSIWGLVLLRHQSGPKQQKSRGWLLLVTPCPVCAASILFSAAFFLSVFPDRPVWTMVGMFVFFLVISVTVMVLCQFYFSRLHHGKEQRPESFLGGVMLLIAAYFMFSVTVMPHVGDLSRIYRLALYTSTAEPADVTAVLVTFALLATAFAWGFGLTLYRKRRCS